MTRPFRTVSVATACVVLLVWLTSAHNCPAFSNVQNVVPLTEQRSLEDLVPLIVKGINKEQGDFDLQHDTTALVVTGPVWLVEAGVKFVRERIIGGQKSVKHGILMLATHTAPDVIQPQRNFCWVLDLKRKSYRLVHSLGCTLPPFQQIQPLPRTSLLDVDLSFEMSSLLRRLPDLPVDKEEAEQSNGYAKDRKPQIRTIQRIFSGIVGFLFFCFGGWSLYRIVVVDNRSFTWFLDLSYFCGRLLLGVALWLLACAFLDSALFDAGIWLLLVR